MASTNSAFPNTCGVFAYLLKHSFISYLEMHMEIKITNNQINEGERRILLNYSLTRILGELCLKDEREWESGINMTNYLIDACIMSIEARQPIGLISTVLKHL